MDLESYTFKKYVFVSTVVSFIIGVLSFLILKPISINTSKGTIQSIDSARVAHTQISYGYDLIAVLIIISFIILLIMFKPIKKIKNKELKFKGDR